jgi:uncharacterized protein DUF5681
MEKEKKPRGNPRIADAGVATRFKPGHSGNPGGKPRRTPYADAHRIVAELPVAELKSSSTDPVPIGIAKSLARKALEGNISAAAECANRTEGPPRQTVEQEKEGRRDGKAKPSYAETLRAIKQFYGLEEQPHDLGETEDADAETSPPSPPRDEEK